MYFTDVSIFFASDYLEDRFSLVVELGSDMPANIVIALVLMKDRMDVKTVLTGPPHQQANYFRSLS